MHVPTEVALAPVPVAVSVGRRTWRAAAGSLVGAFVWPGEGGGLGGRLGFPTRRALALSVVQAPGACRLLSGPRRGSCGEGVLSSARQGNGTPYWPLLGAEANSTGCICCAPSRTSSRSRTPRPSARDAIPCTALPGQDRCSPRRGSGASRPLLSPSCRVERGTSFRSLSVGLARCEGLSSV